MKYLITRRRFLQAAGLAALTAAAGSLTACGKAESDWEYISGRGKLVIGMTIFDPMNYYDDSGKLVGFDTELAQAACEKLGIEAEFQEIDWDNKVIELNSKNIDCIWNGMTVTDDLAKSIDFSITYSGNMQVCVIRSSDAGKFTDIASVNAAGVKLGAEAGSAGEAAAQSNFPNAAYTSMGTQRDCLTELESGTLDVGVMDYVMAVASTGDGTSYTDLQVIDGLELSKEEYAVGLRKGSDFTAKLNETLQALSDEGKFKELQEKYPSVMVTL